MPPSGTVREPGHAIAEPDVRSDPWIFHGVVAGAIGASAIAIFFLIVDSIAGRALWTPHALGSIVFRGVVPGPGDPIEPLLVLGYTGVHGAVFIAFGYLAAFERLIGRQRPGGGTGATFLVTAAVLFAIFELVFEGLAGILERFSPLAGQLGGGRVAAANLLAALGMAGYLTWARNRRDSLEDE
jgi:hypothetical protein